MADHEQAYVGSCPAEDPEGGLRMSMVLSHPSSSVCYPPTMRVGCPRETELGEAWLGGELCPDGGMHDLRAVTAEELAVLDSDEERPPAVGWVQSPSDGLWHAVQPAEQCPDLQGEGVAAACGHRIPSAAAGHAEEEPKFPTCLPCSAQLVHDRISAGWSI